MSTSLKRISISPKKDFLERLSSTSPISALAEVIWNGLDSSSDEVRVEFTRNKMDGIEEIRVIDAGTGIPLDEVETLFGNLGDSWKRTKGRHHGRALHGKNGQGRLKAFALGNRVSWQTTFATDGAAQSYTISGNAAALDSFAYTAPEPGNGRGRGTTVVISGIDKSHGELLADDARDELAKLFAAYLSQYPDVRILFDGSAIDPSGLQEHKREVIMEAIDLGNGQTVDASVSIIEWRIQTKRAIHLCDASGISLHEIEPGIQAAGFNFTAYIKCDHFRELDKTNLLIMGDLHTDVKAILTKGKGVIRNHFRKRAAERQRQIVEKWKAEAIYPYEEKQDVTPVEEAERQVFDILAVNIESYLPRFDEADHGSRKFTFRLLAQALKDNPASVQQIITEVLGLKQEEQNELATLLKNTSLSNIISSASAVANRLDFLLALENLVFDKDTKKQLLERDQLHKILEKEAWLFDEEFALSGSEQRLEEVLKKHIGELGERKDGETGVGVGDGKSGRIDLMLGRAVAPRSGETDYLIVELKRPSKKIDSTIITQVKEYAMAVAKDERFHGLPARWKFVAISNEMNDYAKADAAQSDKPPGQVWSSKDGRITVWVREWAEVINTARARLDFVNRHLAYETTRENALDYLHKTHAKFIPEVGADETTPEEEFDENEPAPTAEVIP